MSCIPEDQLLRVPIETDDGIIVTAVQKKRIVRRKTGTKMGGIKTYSTTSRLDP